MTIGMIFFCYRKRHQTRYEDGDESGPQNGTTGATIPSVHW
jgi:hypothetical protein